MKTRFNLLTPLTGEFNMKRSLFTTATLAAAAVALAAGGAHAAPITYVDAVDGTSGNTGITGQPLSDTSWVGPNSSSGNSAQWNKRTGFATGGTIYQALTGTNNADPSSIPSLTTTISGLTDGLTYSVWAFFQDNTGDPDSTATTTQNWSLAAGLSPNPTVTYWSDDQPLAAHNSLAPVPGTNGSGTVDASAVDAATLTFAGTAPVVIEGSGTTGERRLYGINLGQVTLSGETTIDVYIEQLIETSSNYSRTWYDGVGYEVVPEPSSLALLGLGGLLVASRRRRGA